MLKEAGAGKATKRKRPQVAAHVKERLERYHRDCVVRETDNIKIDEKRPAPIKNNGGYKRWTAEAILRTCWGLRPSSIRRVVRRRITGKKKKKRTKAMPSPLVQSKRSLARLMRASVGHVQFVRNAVAHEYIGILKKELANLPRCNYAILELTLDET